MKQMTTVEATKYVLDGETYYSIAKYLTMNGIKVQPIQIMNYEEGKNKMHIKVAKVFKKVFDINVTDAYNPKKWRR